MAISSYRDLAVWQLSMDLVEGVYHVANVLPPSERFGLAIQLKRSAISVPSNIAEGHARSTTREYLRYVRIALGSLAEAETQLLMAGRLNYISMTEIAVLMERADHVGRMLRRLGQALHRKVRLTTP